jgi:hypothetical protein
LESHLLVVYGGREPLLIGPELFQLGSKECRLDPGIPPIQKE